MRLDDISGYNRWRSLIARRGWAPDDFQLYFPSSPGSAALVEIKLVDGGEVFSFPLESWPEEAIAALEDGRFA